MLKIKQRRKYESHIISIVAVLMILAGIYILTLVAAPTVAPILITKPIDVKTLEKAKIDENRIIIPKIGVNINYAPGEESLDRGAQWRHPDRGNPRDGGNFIIAAHRFSIQPTPLGTIEKSPFYNIDQLAVGETVIVDYQGGRYAYEINKIFDVKPTQIEIEAKTDDARLTLYSCELGGSEVGRIVLIGKLLGQLEQ